MKKDDGWGGSASLAGKLFDSAHWFRCEGCHRFSQTLISGPEYISFVGIYILKTLQLLAATTKRFFWEINFRKILWDFDR